MNHAKLVLAKKDYKKERKQYADGLRMKRLNVQNEDFEPDSFTGCLSLSLQPMSDVQAFLVRCKQEFPGQGDSYNACG